MKKFFFSSLFVIFILTGCNDEAYNNALQKGLDYIASEEFQKAETAFELALEEKEQDVKATALLSQTLNYQEALEALEEAELEIASEKMNEVTEETEGSQALIKKAEDTLSSIEELQTKLIEITKQFETAMLLFEEEDHETAKKTVDNLLHTDLSHPLFQGISNESEKLQYNIEVSINAKEKAEKEKAEKEKAEKEKAEKEKAALEEERAAAKKAEEQKEESRTRLTSGGALELIKNLGGWSPSATFESVSSMPEWAKDDYYGFYINTNEDESNASMIYYLVDMNDGKIYDFSRGELSPIN